MRTHQPINLVSPRPVSVGDRCKQAAITCSQRRPHPAAHHRALEIRHQPRRRREPRRVQRRRHRGPRLHQEAHAGGRARSARRHGRQHHRPSRRQQLEAASDHDRLAHRLRAGRRQLRWRRRRARRDRGRADAARSAAFACGIRSKSSCFADEEGGTVGSLAMAGHLEPDALDIDEPQRQDDSRRHPRDRRRSGSPGRGATQAGRAEGVHRAAHRAGRDSRRERHRHRRRRRHRRHSLVGRHHRRRAEPCGHDADESSARRDVERCRVRSRRQSRGDEHAGSTGRDRRPDSRRARRAERHPGQSRDEPGDSRSRRGEDGCRVRRGSCRSATRSRKRARRRSPLPS